MKRLLTGALLTLSFASHAELVSTDWKTEGDALATLDTETGIEWLDLSETDELSIDTVISMTSAGGEFEGWRLPTQSEVTALLQTLFPAGISTGKQTSTAKYGESVSAFYELFGYTATDTPRAYGLYQRDDTGAVRMAGASGSDTVFANYSHSVYSTTLSHTYYGVWLVSDGGDTLSSINDPSLNIMNANSPYNVPLAGSGALALLALGAGVRKKSR
ncbi:hypothetical protein BM525_18935 (plasmid) [Alteromonas mediterranea]|uniref:DUF1566 domain-containing protein n=1 Tax=Alteromonas mediterranea TaxID=314275 RepID=A0AAC9JEA9_9ALTE|nr:hypothetical protein [Alteromonas mediterranea]APD91959.1 hypothetical protein BM524_18740 [Alteromonas mediterranea]APD99813.1 hypothetical protein BM525_18935 [Alteromonas mediterranea]